MKWKEKKAKFSHQPKGEDIFIGEINGYKTVISFIKCFQLNIASTLRKLCSFIKSITQAFLPQLKQLGSLSNKGWSSGQFLMPQIHSVHTNPQLPLHSFHCYFQQSCSPFWYKKYSSPAHMKAMQLNGSQTILQSINNPVIPHHCWSLLFHRYLKFQWLWPT